MWLYKYFSRSNYCFNRLLNRFYSKNDSYTSEIIIIAKEEKFHNVYVHYSRHSLVGVRLTDGSHSGACWTSGRCRRSLPLHEKLRTVQEHVRRLFRRRSLCKELLQQTRTGNSFLQKKITEIIFYFKLNRLHKRVSFRIALTSLPSAPS